jgi:septum site-determining protein MinC
VSQVFEIKGSVLTLNVLHLYTDDIGAVERELAARLADTPAFFRNTPVIIDLQALPEPAVPDFNTLVQVLRAHYLTPVAVRNIRPALEAAAMAAGLGLLALGRQTREPKQAPEPAQTVINTGKIIAYPVRSGQQIYAQSADLIVLGPVSPGAEILADGHIHVYAPMRGRALAGIKGDVSARIFCQALEAELVSVAGHYRVIESPADEVWGKPAQVRLVENRLLIEPL